MGSENGNQDLFNRLTRLACEQGADRAAIISTADILVEDRLADLCKDPGCENYGLSASCPPHVSGPAGLRETLTRFNRAIFFNIDVPTEILLSEERRHVFKLLHEIATCIERTALDLGYTNAMALAGGSCKKIFCPDKPNCRVVHDSGPCRHPNHARPSMSGYGINVARLMETVGWELNKIDRTTDPDPVPMGTVSGLVLIG